LLGTVGRSAGLDGLLPQLEEVGQVALLSLLLHPVDILTHCLDQ